MFQIEKGPVDAITHEARYSLSEDRLLREAVAAKTVSNGRLMSMLLCPPAESYFCCFSVKYLCFCFWSNLLREAVAIPARSDVHTHGHWLRDAVAISDGLRFTC